MIYKDVDNKEAVVAILERMLTLAGPDKQPLIERELRTMRAGIRSEREAAYLLDSWLRDATRTAVVHDLRLDPRTGHVAQIDHVLIHRTRRFYVLDTKCFAQHIKITEDGAFLRWSEAAGRFEPVPSPLEQCRRNARLLRRALAHLGVQDAPVEALVLVAPSARIERPRRRDTAAVMKADVFVDRLHGLLEDPAGALAPLGGLLRTGLYDSIGDIAKRLAALHRPSTADYMARFGVGGVLKPREAAPARTAAPAHAAAQARTDTRVAANG